MRYDVVSHEFLTDLITEVNTRLENGWTLVGQADWRPNNLPRSDLSDAPGWWFQTVTHD